MDGSNSLWLQESVHVPDQLGISDHDAEMRLLQQTPAAAASAGASANGTPQQQHVSTQRTAAQRTAAAERSGIPSLRDMQMPTDTQLRDSAPSTPRGAPASSQPMPRGGRVSIASADFYLQQRIQQLQDDMKSQQKQLDDLAEERDLLSKLLQSEKSSTNAWKAKYNNQLEREDEAVAAQLEKLRRVAEERDEANKAAARVETDFAQFRAEVDRTISGKIAAALRGPEEDLKEAGERINDLEAMLKEAEHQADRAESMAADIARLNETVAFNEEELRVSRDDAERMRRDFDNQRLEADAQHHAQLASLRDEHAAAVQSMQRDHAGRIDQLQGELEDKLSAARQRVSQGEQARESLRRREAEMADLQDQLSAKQDEIERGRESAAAQRRRIEDGHAEEMEAAAERHSQAIASLIAEHNEEIARLKQRLSHGEAASDRAIRVEKQLESERERADTLQADVDGLRAEVDECRRTIARRDDALAEATQRASEQETRCMRIEDELNDKMSTERQNLHERIEQLLGNIERLNRDHGLEEESFAEQLADARKRQSEAEASVGEMRSGFAKERMQLIQAEAEARQEATDLSDQRDEAIRAKRQLEAKLEGAIADLNSLDRKLCDAETAAHEARRREAEARREASAQRRDTDRFRAQAADLDGRLADAESAAIAAREQAASAAAQMPRSTNRASRHDDAGMPNTSALPPPTKHLSRAATAITGASPSPAPADPMTGVSVGGGNFNGSAAALDAIGPRKQNFAEQRQRPVMQSAAVEPSMPVDFTPAQSRPHGNTHANNNNNRAALSPSDTNQSQGKRHRSEERSEASAWRSGAKRIFAATGFDPSQRVLDGIAELGDAEVAEVAANSATPNAVTHLITSGQMTVKLLTALVKGAWVLSDDFVKSSVARGEWQAESAFGFRHKRPLLKGRTFLFTDAFKKSRHFSTARLVATEGDADVRADLAPGDARHHANPAILCTPQELRAMRQTLDGDAEVMTWDSMVKTIYPAHATALVSGKRE